jgi:solute carrier family 45, member 1/2/4
VQATLRTFISDVAPTHQQEIANAWSSRLSGIGNVIGYSFGLANLVKTFWFFGHMQVRIIAVIASFFVAVSLAASVAYIKEPDPKRYGDPSKGDMGLINFLRKSVRAWGFVSEQIKRVCYAQFCNWIGWFPFLFYFSEYVAALYTNPIYAANPHLSPAELTRVKEEGVRVGNVAFLAYALSSLVSSIVIPFLIIPAYEKRKFRIAATKTKVPSTEPFPSDGNAPAPAGANTVGVPASLLPPEYASYVPAETAAPVHEAQIESPAKRFVKSLQIPGFSLRRAWFLSQIVFSLCMFATFLVGTPMGAFVLGGVTGVAWSITAWAPFSIITGEIGKKNDERRARLAAQNQQRRPTDSSSVTALPSGSKDDLNLEDKTEEDAANIQAGLILGLHNVAICAPQIIATVVGAAIFLCTQKPIGTAGDNSVAWVFRFGGLAAILAAVMTKRVFETADVTRMSETPFGIRVGKLWAKVGGKRFESVVGLIWSMVCNACWTVFGPVLRPVARMFKGFGRWFMGEKKEATTVTV